MNERHLVGGFRAAVFTDYDRLGKLRNAQDPNPTEVKENHTECTDTVTEHLFTNTKKKKQFFFFPNKENFQAKNTKQYYIYGGEISGSLLAYRKLSIGQGDTVS